MDHTLNPNDYVAIHDFLERRAGIRLGEDKQYLVVSRLGKLLPHFALDDFSALASRLSQPEERGLQTAVVDAMTTNETFWFRDIAHFHAMITDVLTVSQPERLRIWSAAASTGQEAYTAAICLQDAIQSSRVRPGLAYEILGTDVSEGAIREARGGVYCGMSAGRGLSDDQRRRYFREENGCIEILPKYRRNLSFRTFNLLQPFDGLGRFDIVFCRNVLIYFSRDRKRDIVERLARVLNPGGHLFLGSTESMNGHEDLFEMRHIAGGLVYRLRA